MLSTKLEIIFKILNQYTSFKHFKGRLQSLLRMSVIVFPPEFGISVYTRSSRISGNNARVVFFCERIYKQQQRSEEFSKICCAFLSDNPSNNELLRQYDEQERILRSQGCFQSVSKCSLFYCFPRWRVSVHASLRFLIILHSQAPTKRFQEKINPRRIGHFTQHSCYSPPSQWILQ